MSAERHIQNPYPGPQPFGSDHEKLFFGRDRETDDLVSLLTIHPAVLLYAQSGAGKTSLLNAGLIPLIEHEDEGFEVLPVARVRGFAQDGMVTKDIDNIYVFNALMSWAGEETDPDSLANMSLADFLRERAKPRDEDGLEMPRLLVFDQFEEIFTEHAGHWEERKHFFIQIDEALKQDPILRVLFVVREDYLAELTPYADYLPERLRARYRLERLHKAEASMAVKGPIQGTGRSYAEGVAESLVQKLLQISFEGDNGAVEELTGEYVEPVQLQVVCQNLWANLPADTEIITTDHLQEFGDVEKALHEFYETSIASAAEEASVSKDDLRAWFSRELITPAGTRSTVFQGAEQTGSIPNSVVAVLENQHIIRAEMRARARWYELTHDRLIEPIRKANAAWQQWQQEEEQQSQIEAERQRADEQQRRADEQARIARRFRRLTVMLLISVSLALIAAVYALWQTQIAKEQTQIAREKESDALLAQRDAEESEEEARNLLGKLQEQIGLTNAEAKRADIQTAKAKQSDKEAEEAINIALSQKLVTQVSECLESQDELDNQVDLALLLSVAAWKTNNTLDSRISMLNALQHSYRIEAFLHGNESSIYSVASSKDGELLASGNDDGEIVLWDVKTKRRLKLEGAQTEHTDRINSVSFSPDGKWLASGSKDTKVILWDVKNRKKKWGSLAEHENQVNCVSFDKNSKLLASGGDDGNIIIWRVETGQKKGQPLAGHTRRVTSVAFNPNGKWLASGSDDGNIIIWDVETGQKKGQSLTRHTKRITSVAFSPDGNLLASGSADNSVIIWDAESGEPLKRLEKHGTDVVSLAFSSDSKWLASGDSNGTIILWDAESRDQKDELTGYHKRLYSLCFIPNSNLLASGGKDKKVALWDLGNEQQIRRELIEHKYGVDSMSFSQDGKLLALRSKDNSIILWDMKTGEKKEMLKKLYDPVIGVSFDPNGNLLALGSKDKSIILWNAETGKKKWGPKKGHGSQVNSISFSPDGNLLASGDQGGKIILWDAGTGKQYSELQTENPVRSLAFSPNGKRVVSGSYNGKIALWNVDTGKPYGKSMKHGDQEVWDLAFSFDGEILASGSSDGIILWDVDKGQRIGQLLTGHESNVKSISFSSDGKYMASGGSKGKVILWDMDPKSWEDFACRIANRNITRAEWKQFAGDEEYRRTRLDLPVLEK